MRVPHVLVPLVIAAGAACGSSSGTMSKLPGTAGAGGATAGQTGAGGASAGTSGAGEAGRVGGAGTSGGQAGTNGAAGTSGGAGTNGGAAGTSGATTAGCGLASPPAVGAANPQTINVTDSKGTTTARQFYVSLPASYDSSQPTRVVFAWHYAGGSASALISSSYGGNFYGIQPLLPNTIFVAGQGLLSTPGDATTSGWPNTNGGDVAFAKAMIAWVEANFCVDPARILSTGMSYGGIMSDTLGCQMPDVFRAVGVMSGALYNFGTACKSHPIAAWITHGDADTTVDISGDETARDQFLADNHCGTTTTAVTPSPCVSYSGCDSGYPVVWCEVAGEGHTIPSFAASGIANFFAQF
jgi:poly(3-hydroxybutyrate) depolymerase